MRYYFTAILYYLLLIPISVLPFRVLYIISDGLSWLLFNVVGYRKKVVVSQIRNSFPEKSEVEVQATARKFYTHLCDLMVESIKFFTISRAEAVRRFKCVNPEVADQYAKQGRHIIISAGHYSNFEFAAMGCCLNIQHQVFALYAPLHNPFFEKKIRKSRSKFGTGLVSKSELKRFLNEDLKEQKKPVAFLFAVDQSPPEPKNAYWMEFLNQDTGVQYGAEKYARDYDLVVVYGRLHREKRGFYSWDITVINDNATQAKQGEILEKMTRAIEADIRKHPEWWLWSHRRWKHKNPYKSIENVA